MIPHTPVEAVHLFLLALFTLLWQIGDDCLQSVAVRKELDFGRGQFGVTGEKPIRN